MLCVRGGYKKEGMKIVINKCYGGFSISVEAAKMMAKLGDKQAELELNEWNKKQAWLDYFKAKGVWPKDCPQNEIRYLEISAKYDSPATFHGYGYVDGFDGGYSRTSETLVKAVEKLGKKASGQHASLEVIEIPDGIDYYIDEYDGIESVHENHRSW